MARYGSFRYSEQLYGVDTTTNNLWALEIDWTGAGYDGSNEASRMIGLSITRGRNYMLNTGGDGFQRVQAGRATFTLDNADLRYDPYNTASPLYGYLLPGKSFRLSLKNGTDGTLFTVMTGFIDDIRPASGSEKVQIAGVDLLESLQQLFVQHADVEQSIRIDTAVQTLLTAAGTTDVNIDPISDVIFYWWADNKIAANEIGKIEDASLGTFFIANDGTASFYARRRSGVSSVLDIESDDILRDVTVSQPWDTVRNQIELTVNPRTLQSESIIWSIPQALLVSANSTTEIWAAYRYDNKAVPAVDVAVTVPSSDFVANAEANGTGADMTSDFTLTVTDFSESAKLVISNTAAGGGYVTVLNVKGKAITEEYPVIVRDEDAASIAAYGTRRFAIDSVWQQNTNDAVDRASLLLNLLATARKNPSVRFQGRPDIQFTPDLFDRVSLDVPYLSIEGAYRVGSIQHEWTGQNGQEVVTTMALEPIVDYSAAGYWVFPTTLGETSILA